MASKKQYKKNNTNTISQVIERGVILMIFTLLWLFLSILYIKSTSGITVLLHDHSKESIISGDRSELLAGEVIKGRFKAKEANLGIVAVRFNTFFRINEDIVRFRIREVGQRNWYYEHDYTTPQFQPNDLFTFGFPVIPDSDERSYEFEIESLRGEKENAVALSYIEPIMVSKYQYSRERILSDNSYLSEFLLKKTINAFTNINFLISSLVYALPLLLYIIKLFFFDKYLRDKHVLSVLPIVLMLLLCIIDLPRMDEAVIGVTGLWMVVVFAYALDRTVSFLIALFFIFVSIILLPFSIVDLSRNLTMWTFMLLLAGILQFMIGNRFGWRQEKKIFTSESKIYKYFKRRWS